MSTNDQEKTKDVDSHPLQKMRSRLLSEDYKYRMLNEDKENLEDDDGTRRSSRISYMKCLLVLLLILILGLIAILIWQHTSTEKQPCVSEDCVKTSAYILNKMNTSADPCEDFYEYACGRWTDRIIPPDKAKYGTFQEVDAKATAFVKMVLDGSESTEKSSKTLKKARSYFEMCLDSDAIDKRGNTPLLKLIKTLGSWPLTSDNLSGEWKAETWDFIESLATNHNYSGRAFFFTTISADDKNSSINRISFDQTGLTLRSYEEYLKENVKEYHDAFITFATEFLRILKVDNSTAVKMMEQVWSLELKMAQAFVPKEELINVEKIYHKMTVQEFQNLLSNTIDIKTYLNKLLHRHIPENEEIIVYTPAYFKKLIPILNSTPKDVIATYMVWSYVNSVTGYLPSKYVDASMVLTRLEDGVSVISPLWQRCTDKTISAFGFAISAEYVKAKFSSQQKDQAEGIFDDILSAFISNIPTLDWMDSETKKVAIDKAKAVVKTIGYPDWILDNEKLDEYYNDITITEGEFFESHLSKLHFSKWRRLKRFHTEPDRTEWSMIPIDINAYYTSTFNKIVVPAAILQRPFYDPKFPWSFNLGSMGMVVGHELTHGFDNKGGKFDKFGNMKVWWGEESRKQFSKKRICMEEQYANYTIQGLHVNGKYTVSENIADNGGVRSAYTAFRKWKKENAANSVVLPGLGLDDDQLFFLGYSQVWCSYYTPTYARQTLLTDLHSPSRYRVIGVLSNMPEFSRAFNCPRNSAMTNPRRCRVW